MSDEVKKILADLKAIIDGDHIVYKAGTHGMAYIDKEKFSQVGAGKLAGLLRRVVSNAISKGIVLADTEPIGVIGPAYGAIPYALTVAEEFENALQGTTFFPARTELVVDTSGKKIHVIPEKLQGFYSGKKFVALEDIVNNGTTLRELKPPLEAIGAKIIAALAVADRGGQTTESLGIEQYFPLMRVDMAQYDARGHKCPLCEKGVPINTVLGKGERWVKLFGQPPYDSKTDFSKFWE